MATVIVLGRDEQRDSLTRRLIEAAENGDLIVPGLTSLFEGGSPPLWRTPIGMVLPVDGWTRAEVRQLEKLWNLNGDLTAIEIEIPDEVLNRFPPLDLGIVEA